MQSLSRNQVQAGGEYETVEITSLWDAEDAHADEMCVVGEGKAVQVVTKGSTHDYKHLNSVEVCTSLNVCNVYKCYEGKCAHIVYLLEMGLEVI